MIESRVRTALIAFLIAALASVPATASAHPGGLDADGCHVCRTDCARYNLSDGERHCHRDADSAATASSAATAPPPPNYDLPVVGNTNQETGRDLADVLRIGAVSTWAAFAMLAVGAMGWRLGRRSRG